MLFSPNELREIALALADVLDEAASEADEFKMFGRSEIWRKANLFLVRTKPEDFGEIVTNAKSINWLADFLRTQATDSRKQAREGLWLSQSEFSSAVDSLIDRLANLTKDELFALPEPLSALFLWLQHGDPSQLRLYLKIASRSHQGFISVLHLMHWMVQFQ